MEYQNLKFSGHAIHQMFRREIKQEDVAEIVRTGQIIREYWDDTPYPSFLILGFIGKIPLHIVAANDKKTKTVIIITAYIPDKQLWTDNFRKRRGDL